MESNNSESNEQVIEDSESLDIPTESSESVAGEDPVADEEAPVEGDTGEAAASKPNKARFVVPALVAVLALAIIAVVGYSLMGNKTPEPPASVPEKEAPAAQAPEPEEPAKDEGTIIGKDSADAVRIPLLNASGKAITALSLKLSTDVEFPASLMRSGQTISKDEKMLLCVAKEAANSAASGSSESPARAADAIMMRTLYDLRIEFADGLIAELHGINPEAMNDLRICLTDDGIAYVEYTTVDGKTESTLQTEMAIKAEVEAARAQAEADAQALAEAEAAAAQAAESEANQGYDYNWGGAATDSGSGGQREDSCIDPGQVVTRPS